MVWLAIFADNLTVVGVVMIIAGPWLSGSWLIYGLRQSFRRVYR
jgi:hypothetical protein